MTVLSPPSPHDLRNPTLARATRVLGAMSALGIAVLLVLGLVVSPPALLYGETVRLVYVHPAVATITFVAFGVCALASLAYLWPRTRSPRWDHLAGASAEVGVLFCAATLVSGSIWGRYTWGVWWTWDALLTLTLMLFVVFVGYLALRRTGGDPVARAKRCAVTALLAFLLVPIDHYSTSWWNTLHQGNTILRVGKAPLIEGWQLVTMLLSFVVFSVLFAWILLRRFEVESMEARMEDEGYVLAVAERRAEGR